MTKAESLTLAFFVVVAVFSADLVRVLGWHWLAFWPVYVWAVPILIVAASAVEAFVRGFKRGFNRGRGK